MRKEQAYKITYLLFLNLAIVFTLLFAFNKFNILIVSEFISSAILFSGIFISLAISLIHKSKLNNFNHRNSQLLESFFSTSQYFFLAILIVITANQFLKLDFITSRNIHLVALGTFFGFFAFYTNRNKIESGIENEKQREEDEEKRRSEDFQYKFPTINRILGLRRIIKSMYKNGFVYSLLVFILFLIGFLIRIWHLGDLSLWWDELITGTYVSRILENGLPLAPSGLEYYWRGIAYHYFVAFFTSIFGNVEFWVRFPSVLFGMGIIFISFIYSKKINKKIALLVLIFLIFSTYNLEYSRFARFYVMNAFLFMLAISFVWKGFFEEKNKYKIYSAILFFLMILTVELGGVFLGLIIVVSIYRASNNLPIGKKRIIWVMAPLFLFFIIYLINNPFQYFQIEPDNYGITSNPINENDDGIVRYAFLKVPKISLSNTVIPFYNQFHISAMLIIPFVLSFLVTLNKRIKKISFYNYLILAIILTAILFEIVNPYVDEPRLYFLFESLYVMFSLTSIYVISKLIFKNTNICKIFNFALVVLFLLSIYPSFYERVNINYGDDVSNDPFRTTWAQAYRADYKSTYQYLSQNSGPDDIWINVMEPAYFYYNKNPNFIINQNYRWNYMWREETFTNKNGDYIDLRYGSVLLNEARDIERVIEENPDRNVWVLINGGSTTAMHTIHLRQDVLKFIEMNNNRTIFLSEDNISKVLLFNKS